MAKTQANIAGKPYSVEVAPKVLELCGIKSRYAEDLDLEELRALVNWCNGQDESLWDGMTVQEILNVYRVSAEWVDWQAWAQERPLVARAAWNRVVQAHNFLKG